MRPYEELLLSCSHARYAMLSCSLGVDLEALRRDLVYVAFLTLMLSRSAA